MSSNVNQDAEDGFVECSWIGGGIGSIRGMPVMSAYSDSESVEAFDES